MRKCIFCGERANSKEHAWPAWLVAALNVAGPVIVEAERGGESLPPWQQIDHTLTVRLVCGACNNGWMSQLESKAKPLVLSLLRGDNVVIGAAAQRLLSAWLTKTAMVFEALRKNADWFYNDAERRSMMNALVLPDRTSVCIAKCVDLPGACCVASDMSESAQRDPSEVHGYVTTMGFGTLACQIATIHTPAHVLSSTAVTVDVQPGPWSECTIPIWPLERESTSWPPPIGLRGELGLSALATRFRVTGGQ